MLIANNPNGTVCSAVVMPLRGAMAASQVSV